MKKLLVLTVILAFSSLPVLADENCNRQCNSNANQMGLQCQKMRQLCMRIGIPDSIQFEMCMEDVSQCLQTGKAIYESCNLACEDEK